ncbi:8-oxo-dGTP diphosphatase [Pelagirhabdus alkalitolerans]|uniref:8-oxo-dGTP diphosphatase n=1 Tax=Pelagirhabdus alkalitolerans TaxID=1612202 RepID=A0A1G6GPH5_9BACI|nr:(deoxy)nucleoside triphosphate pyrophosphohydrolase [Pelagirhabdus alkalitolerans]SDB83665.1 8-oxo-dGTP diphosphatase [Pelagirhabdus alkalitolerans]
MKKTVKVVAAIIENNHNEILCALRSTEMTIPNVWEFPGGKIENGENPYNALKREIEEEMNCTIEPSEILNVHTHEYNHFIIELTAIKAKIVKGHPELSEHDQFVWLKRENLDSLKWAPADIPAVELLINEV